MSRRIISADLVSARLRPEGRRKFKMTPVMLLLAMSTMGKKDTKAVAKAA